MHQARTPHALQQVLQFVRLLRRVQHVTQLWQQQRVQVGAGGLAVLVQVDLRRMPLPNCSMMRSRIIPSMSHWLR